MNIVHPLSNKENEEEIKKTKKLRKVHPFKIENNYDMNYRCKYNDSQEIEKYKTLKNENDDIDLEIDVENELFRLDLLNIFKLDRYNDSSINNTIDFIYDNYLQNSSNVQIKKFRECVEKALELFLFQDEDKKLGLTILFSYEYLNITHNCISELLKTNTITDETLSKLQKILKI